MYTEHDTERRVAEPGKRAGRTEFQRDRARVLHSAALRRLAGKTQVVPITQSDFPRTRLTHSLECAQIGRELGAALGCDPDLVDAACLAHDIGHPPFGHNGETALAELGGGFEGNAQSLRLLTRLEPKVLGAGLNLTRATLDATLKYPWVGEVGKCGAYPEDAETFAWIRAGAPEGRRCLEAQVMDWADDVAYSVHDLEDGLDSGLISVKALHSSRSRLTHTALTSYCQPGWGVTDAELSQVLTEFLCLDFWQFEFDGGPSSRAAAKNLTSELVGRFCRAAEEATLAACPALSMTHRQRSIVVDESSTTEGATTEGAAAGGGGPRGLSRYAADLVVPRRQLLECALLKAVTAEFVMRRAGAVAAQARERELIAELAAAVALGAPGTLDPLLRPAWDAAASDAARRRVITDQIASLTDTSAVAWHRRLCRLTTRRLVLRDDGGEAGVDDLIYGQWRRDIPGPLRDVVRAQHGVISRRQALDGGLTPAQIKHRISSERWVQLFAGVYSVFTGPPSPDALRWAAVLWGGTGAVLSHESAADVHGMLETPPAARHVSVPLTRRVRSVPGIEIHLSKHVAELSFPPGVLPVTSASDTVLDLAAGASDSADALRWARLAIERGAATGRQIRAAMAARKKLRWRSELDDLIGALTGE